MFLTAIKITPRKCKVADSQEMADGAEGVMIHSSKCTEVSPAACTPSLPILNRAQIVLPALFGLSPAPFQ